MRPVRFGLALVVILLVLLATESSLSSHTRHLATGTWSVVAIDVDTREVGVTLATCVPAVASVVASTLRGADGESVRLYKVGGSVAGGARFELAHLVTGVGAVVAQGLVDAGNATRLAAASAHLRAGGPAEAAIDAATTMTRGPRKDSTESSPFGPQRLVSRDPKPTNVLAARASTRLAYRGTCSLAARSWRQRSRLSR